MGNPDKKYKCVIIDDEPNAIEVIRFHLGSFSAYEVAATFTDGFSALTWIKQNLPDLIFLDIQMPGINGIDVLRNLDKKSAVFLTTAYRHYAPEAFDFEVLDYLLKPMSAERFRKAIRKFEETRSTQKSQHLTDYLVIRANRSDIRIAIHDILYFEAKGDYVKCHTQAQNYLTKESMKNLLERLPHSSFRQIHRSFIVNLDHVEKKSSKEISVGTVVLPISRSYRF